MLIETSRSFFFKVTAISCFFFFLLSILCEVCVFIFNKKREQKYFLCLFWLFSRFGMACAREFEEESIVDDLDSSL